MFKASESRVSHHSKKKEENAASPGCAVKPHGRALEPEGTAFVFSLGGYFGQGDEWCMTEGRGPASS